MTLCIMKPDKGSGVVVMDRNMYNEAIYKVLSDEAKFKKLNGDLTLKREGQLQRFLRKLKKDGFLNEDDYKRVYPSGSQTARIYCLPKLHKSYGSNSSPPFRPIVSSIGTFNYNLSKYLCTLLTPFVSTDFSPQDSFTFVHDIKEVYKYY